MEFGLRRIAFHQQPSFDVQYKGHKVELFVPDLIAVDSVVVDTKVIDRIADHERGVMLNYLRITNLRVGVILNFKRAKLEWERLSYDGSCPFVVRMRMSKNPRFWRNVLLIALAHVALIAGLIRWSVAARASSNPESIVWLGGAGEYLGRRMEKLGSRHHQSSQPLRLNSAGRNRMKPQTKSLW